MRTLMVFTAHQIVAHSFSQIKEMGAVHSTYRGEKMCTQGIGGGNLGERYHLEDPAVDRRIIFKWIFR
jgi:hypothetical protein